MHLFIFRNFYKTSSLQHSSNKKIDKKLGDLRKDKNGSKSKEYPDQVNLLTHSFVLELELE